MKKSFSILIVALAVYLSGCMSDKEYQLRSKDIDAKMAHPATYQPVVLNGPLTLSEGASIIATTPSQPYVQTDIPNGQAIQAEVIQSVTSTAGLVGLGAIAACKSGDSTKKTVNNYNAETKGE